jgi:hypothetical protein
MIFIYIFEHFECENGGGELAESIDILILIVIFSESERNTNAEVLNFL